MNSILEYSKKLLKDEQTRITGSISLQQRNTSNRREVPFILVFKVSSGDVKLVFGKL